MNQMLETIKNRFSCRSFSDQKLSDQQVDTLVTAAVQSPSAMNFQPWRVISLRNSALIQELEDEGLRQLAAMEDKSGYERIKARGGKLFYNAPCVIYIPLDTNVPSAPMDCGIVAQSVALAAQALGLGSCICGMARLSFSTEKAEYFNKALHFPPGFEFGIAVLVGMPTAQAAPHEPDSTKIVLLD